MVSITRNRNDSIMLVFTSFHVISMVQRCAEFYDNSADKKTQPYDTFVVDTYAQFETSSNFSSTAPSKPAFDNIGPIIVQQ